MSDHRRHPRAPRTSRRGSVLVSFPTIPLVWTAAIALAGLAAFAVPGTSESSATQPAAKVDPALGQIGWAATYGTGPSAIKSHTHWAAFALAENESPDPLVAPAAFQADFAGEVQVFETGKYRFRLDAEGGRASLKFYDKLGKEIVNVTSDGTSRGASVQSAWVELPAGPITASVKFARSASKPARLATYWECEMKFAGGAPSGFPLEPLPPPAVRVPKFASAAAQQAEDSIKGRVLLGEYGCVHCHAVDTGDPSAFDRSGVFHRMGPALGEIGRRASPQWLQRWIMNPTQLKPGTHMPDVFGDTPKDASDAEALVHFLAAPHYDPKAAETPATEESVIDRGRALFHTVGCVACHGPIESPAAAFKSDGLSKDTPPQHPVLGHLAAMQHLFLGRVPQHLAVRAHAAQQARADLGHVVHEAAELGADLGRRGPEQGAAVQVLPAEPQHALVAFEHAGSRDLERDRALHLEGARSDDPDLVGQRDQHALAIPAHGQRQWMIVERHQRSRAAPGNRATPSRGGTALRTLGAHPVRHRASLYQGSEEAAPAFARPAISLPGFHRGGSSASPTRSSSAMRASTSCSAPVNGHCASYSSATVW